MNRRKAKQIARLAEVSLKSGSLDKDHGATAMDAKLIAQIHPDGSITEREQTVVEARTTESRYLYRKLKKIYTGTTKEPSVQKQIKNDLKTIAVYSAQTNGGSDD
jgi:hypothetical protein